MAERPDWVPEGWNFTLDGYAERGAVNGRSVYFRRVTTPHGEMWKVMGTTCNSLETAVAIAELLAAERGGWA